MPIPRRVVVKNYFLILIQKMHKPFAYSRKKNSVTKSWTQPERFDELQGQRILLVLELYTASYTDFLDTSHANHFPCISSMATFFYVKQHMDHIRDMHCGWLYGRVDFKTLRGGS